MEGKTIINRETLIPVAVAVTSIFVVASVIFYITGMTSDIRSLKEWKLQAQAKEIVYDTRMASLEQQQAVTSVKLDSIINSMNLLLKKFNIIPSP